MTILNYYLCVINAISFFAMAIDKRRAKTNKKRISERTLLLLSCLGGSIGAILAMYGYHHKTRKKKFSVGLWIILLIQSACYFLVRRSL